MSLINDLKLSRRQFKNASNTKNRFISDVIRNQEQLNLLLNDMENGIFETEELELILKREQQALQGLKTSLKEFEDIYKSNEIRFDSLFQLSKTFKY
jgi:peptidoglycan hydrolase CwlO-like protein